MAPPTPVYDRFEISTKYGDVLSDPEKYHCHKKTITQNECTFRINYPNKVPQVICLPFTREFQRCLFPRTIIKDGQRVKVDKWINIEITDERTNQALFTDEKYRDQLEEFVQADKDLKQLLDTAM